MILHAEFEPWRHANLARFPSHYIDNRLGKENKKATQLLNQESTGFRRSFVPRHLIQSVVKYSGLQTMGGKHAANIQTRFHPLALAHLPQNFEGFRILQISDPHFNGSNAISDALFKSLENVEYDLCVLTGDYRYRSFGPIDDAIAGLKQITQCLSGDIVAILGNHDSIQMVPIMESIGISVLLNESYSVTKGTDVLTIVGVDDPSYYKLADIDHALFAKPLKPQSASVLLAHSPELYREGAEAGFSAYLCGHTHGGQFCLPGGIPLLLSTQAPRRLSSGGWNHNGLSGYTSVGAGVSIVEARFFCPPEITIHVLSNKDTKDETNIVR